MIWRAECFHLATALLECDFATAVLAEVADVWRAVTCVREDNTEKSREEKSSRINTTSQLDPTSPVISWGVNVLCH